jgi:hypothetical protein
MAKDLTGLERGLVFTHGLDEGESLVNKLSVLFFSSGLKKEEDRAKAISDWEQGNTGGVLVGSSSLIQGIHYDHVRFVVFVTPPWGLVDLVQGAGRAGRDGVPARILVIANPGCLSISGEDPEDFQCSGELRMWVDDPGCHRKVISATMDGEELSCAEIPGAESCDRCKRGGDGVIKSVWSDTNDLSKCVPLFPRNLSAFHRSLEPQTQLPLPILHPRTPNPLVIEHSARLQAEVSSIKDATTALFGRLRRSMPTCGICWLWQVLRENNEKPRTAHSNVNDCWRYRNEPLKDFNDFYDYNSPRKKKSKVSNQHSSDPSHHLIHSPSGIILLGCTSTGVSSAPSPSKTTQVDLNRDAISLTLLRGLRGPSTDVTQEESGSNCLQI